MGKSSTSTTVYVGLDVHKDSIDIAVAESGRDGKVRHVGSIGGDLASLDKALRKLISKGQPLHTVYEAGPCGFVIWRHLHPQGLACEVVAPSSIPKRSGERVKTDRRDATLLTRLARAGELTAVRVPDGADKAVRDLVRAPEDAVRECRNERHRLKALLLRMTVCSRRADQVGKTPHVRVGSARAGSRFPGSGLGPGGHASSTTPGQAIRNQARTDARSIERARTWPSP